MAFMRSRVRLPSGPPSPSLRSVFLLHSAARGGAVRSLLLVVALVSAFALPRLHGQTPPPSDAPAFETASVKTNDSRNGRRDSSLAGGRFSMTYSTLHELIVFAFPRPDGRLRSEFEIIG